MSAEPSTSGPSRAVREDVAWLPTTSGLLGGIVGLLAATGLVGFAVVDWSGDVGPQTLCAAVFVAALSWSVLLRPRVGLVPADRPSRLRMRGMVSTLDLPLVGIGSPAVRQMLVVPFGEGRFLSASIGASRRRLRQAERGPDRQRRRGLAALIAAETTERPRHHVDVADLVVDRISRAADEARRLRDPEGPPARRWAWPEIVVLAGSLVLGLVLALS